jgi:hypothetical protein
VTRDATAIADRITMGAGPFAHRRRVQCTAAAAPSLRRRRPIGGLRGYAGSTGSTTRSQPATCSGQLIEVGLAQVEFVSGSAVVHSNRRHGLGAVTVKIADKHDTRLLGHNSSLQRHTSNGPTGTKPRRARLMLVSPQTRRSHLTLSWRLNPGTTTRAARPQLARRGERQAVARRGRRPRRDAAPHHPQNGASSPRRSRRTELGVVELHNRKETFANICLRF